MEPTLRSRLKSAQTLAIFCLMVLCNGCNDGETDSVHNQAEPAQIQFSTAVDYPTGGGGPGPAPQGTIATDVDGDGDSDVVICDSRGNSLRLLKNHGDGIFDSGIAIPAIPNVGSVNRADFNLDGRVDLLGATLSSVVVLLGQGDGSFTISQTIPALTGAQIQAIAFDANQDMASDIVMIWHGGIRSFLGRGDGTFGDGPYSLLAREPTALTQATFDSDSVPDLAVVDVLLQQAVALRGRGDGSFERLDEVGVGLVPESIVPGRFNGDEWVDFAVADSFSFTVSVLLGDSSGKLRRDATYPVNGPSAVAIADFNNDSHQDIVASALLDDQLIILSGDGTGSFIEAGRYDVTNAPQTPVTADFNDDGKVDIAVGGDSGELSILLNRTGE